MIGLRNQPEGSSLVQRAIAEVTEHIRANNLRVGDTLPSEAHFAATLGVSRPVMREAFRALAALRLIDVANGRKARVSALDGAVIAASLDHAMSTAQVSVADVWDVRRTVEMRTVALAAASRSDEEAQHILDHVEAMAASIDDLEAMTAHDIAFHQTIAKASRNLLFAQLVASFGQMMQVAVPAAWQTRTAAEQRELMIDRHRAVAAAIAECDPEKAVAAMDAHFDASIGDILKAQANPHGG
jgi:DNA-binding FadR family transcriptional regulator